MIEFLGLVACLLVFQSHINAVILRRIRSFPNYEFEYVTLLGLRVGAVSDNLDT